MADLRFSALALVLCLALFPAGSAALAGPDGTRIMEQVEAQPRVADMSALQQMTLTDSRGQERRRFLKLYLTNQGRDSQRLLFVTSPPAVRGIGLLTHDYGRAGQDDDQWIFLPALGRTKRIAAKQRNLSFLGSDFSYADLTRPQTGDWNFRLLEEKQWRGKPVWTIEARPRDSRVEDAWGYRRSILTVRRDLLMVVRSVHWLSGSQEIKQIELDRLENHQGFWLPTQVRARTGRGGRVIHQTDLSVRDIKVNQGLEPGLFSLRGLEKGI